MSSISKLIGLADQMKSKDWACEYRGQSYPAGGVKISKEGGAVTLKFQLKIADTERKIVIGEHIEGGGDWLDFDGARRSANHEIAFKFKLFPPSTKIILKSEFDMDNAPGFDDVSSSPRSWTSRYFSPAVALWFCMVS